MNKNLDLVIVTVLVVLIIGSGIGGYYYLNLTLEEAKATLATKVDQLNRKAQEQVAPSEENKQKAIQNKKLAEVIVNRIKPFLSESDPLFDEIRVERGAAGTPPKGLTGNVFQRRLLDTSNALNKLAEKNQVKLQKAFFYSFDEFYTRPAPEDKTFQLGIQLLAIKELSTILYNSKITEFKGVKRVSVESNSGSGKGGSSLDAKVLTGPNKLYDVYPFQLQFRCSPAAFTAVLNAIHASPMLFIVRSVSVQNDKETIPTEADLRSLQNSVVEGATRKIFFIVAGQEEINVTMWIDLLYWADAAPAKPAAPEEGPAPTS